MTDKNGQIAESDVCNITVATAETTLNLTLSPADYSEIPAGKPVTVTANVSGGNGTYSYVWDYSHGGTYTTVSGNNKNTYTITPTSDKLFVGCTVTSGSQTKTVRNLFYVKAAATPLSVTVSAPTTAKAGISETLTATVTGGKAPYTIKWYKAKASSGSWGSAQGTGTTFYASFMEAGTWQVLCDVYDADGKNVYKTVTITVTSASTPLSVSIPSSASGKTGQTLSIPATVSGGTAPYTYTWYYRKASDSTWSKSGATGSVYDPTFSTATTWYCYVYVTDKNGNTKTSSTCTITVTSLAVSLSPGTYANNVGGHYSPSVSGGSGSYTYSWSWSGAGSGSSTSSYLNFYGWNSGTYTIKCTVKDTNTGAIGTATQSITVKKL